MTRLALAAALALVPLSASAQSQLDRLESISERSNDMMLGAMVQMLADEGLDTSTLPDIPPMEWTDAMRAAGDCMLAAYTAEIGSDGVDRMLGSMETALDDMEGLSLDEMTDVTADLLPEGVTEEMSLEITQSCGMIDAQMEWMRETGVMDALFGASMQIDG